MATPQPSVTMEITSCQDQRGSRATDAMGKRAGGGYHLRRRIDIAINHFGGKKRETKRETRKTEVRSGAETNVEWRKSRRETRRMDGSTTVCRDVCTAEGRSCTSVRAVCLHVSAHCLHPVANQPVKCIPTLHARVDCTTRIIARRQFIKNTAYGASV